MYIHFERTVQSLREFRPIERGLTGRNDLSLERALLQQSAATVAAIASPISILQLLISLHSYFSSNTSGLSRESVGTTRKKIVWTILIAPQAAAAAKAR